MKPLLRAAAALLLLPLLPAGGPAAADEGTWTSVRSPNFTVFSNAGGAATEQAAADLERLRSFLVDLAPRGRFDAEVPYRIYLFDDPRSLARFHPRGDGSAERGAAGLLVPHDHGVYGLAVWATDGGLASRFLFKQYVLWVLGQNLPEAPDWLSQGVAEFYSTFSVEDGKARVGLPVREHALFLAQPAETMAGKPRLEESGKTLFELQGDAQPLSWALVHYLLLGNLETRSAMPAYLRRLVSGEDPDAAYHASFGASLAEVRARLRAYVAGDRFRYLEIPAADLPSFELRSQPLSAAEVEYRLGDLLAHVAPRRRAAAEARFRRALELDPEHGPARAGLGWLAAEAGDPEAALAAYEVAAKHAPDDFLVRYLYADGLLSSLGRGRPEGEEELATLRRAQTELRRAVGINPDDPAAWERLGLALSLEPEASREAVDALERALELRPGRSDLAVNLLLAYARLRDVEGADRVMAELRQRGADPETLTRAQEIRLRLRLHEANLLARQDRLDDAVAVLARVLAETADPSLAELAAAQLQRVSRVAEHNRYAASYQEAVRLIAAGDPRAGEAVETLQAAARPGLQTAAAAELAARWRRTSQETDP